MVLSKLMNLYTVAQVLYVFDKKETWTFSGLTKFRI